jgi:hypothetical protein
MLATHGDGKAAIKWGDVKGLISSNGFANDASSFFFLTAHGNVLDSGGHCTDFGGVQVNTRSIFSQFRNKVSPVYVLLASCHSGVCEPDVELLPKGSVVFTTAHSSDLGYGVDGRYIADALAIMAKDNLRPDFAMYFLVHTYLSLHGSDKRNLPALIIRGYGDVVAKSAAEFERLKVHSNPSFLQDSLASALIHWPSISESSAVASVAASSVTDSKHHRFLSSAALANSRFSELFDQVRKELLELDYDDWRVSQTATHKSLNLFATIAWYLNNPQTSVTIHDKLRWVVTTAMHDSALLMYICRNEEEIIRIVRKHMVQNSRLLHRSLREEKYDLALCLLNLGTKIDNSITKERNLLSGLMRRGRDDVVCALIGGGYDLTEASVGAVPLIFTASRDHVNVLTELCAVGVNVNVRSRDDGRTPLHFADVRSAGVLLAAGANPNLRDRHGFTPIHAAIMANDFPKFKVLYESYKTNRWLRSRGRGYMAFANMCKANEISRYLREKYNAEVGMSASSTSGRTRNKRSNSATPEVPASTKIAKRLGGKTALDIKYSGSTHPGRDDGERGMGF